MAALPAAACEGVGRACKPRGSSVGGGRGAASGGVNAVRGHERTLAGVRPGAVSVSQSELSAFTDNAGGAGLCVRFVRACLF